MSTLRIKANNAEFKKFPKFLQEYASYLTGIEAKSEKTVCEYLLDLRTFLRYFIMINSTHNIDLDEISIDHLTLDDLGDIDTQTVVNFLAFARTDLENNNTTRNRKLSSLKSFYKHFYTKKHMLDKNPTEAIDSIKKSRTLSKYLSIEEAVALLEAVSNDKESKTRQRDYSIISLFLNTGMRLSELCGLNLESFDREISYVKVIGKGNKERIIYLNTAAKDAVISYLKIRLDPRFIHTSEHAFFLSARQTRISPKTVQWMVGKYLDLAGLGSKGYSVHKLRHTAATLMYQSGKVDVRVLKDILGHEQLNTTQIYTHLVNRNMEEAMYNNPLSDFTVKKQ